MSSLTAQVELSPDPRDETPFEVVLERGRKAYGYVVDPDGQPIAGARIRRWELKGYGGKANTDTRAQEDGRFEIPNLGGAGFDLLVQAQGYAQVFIPRLGIPEDESGNTADVDLGTVRLERAVSLEGRVVDQQQQPIAGATVRTLAGRAPGRRRKAMTTEVESDEKGRFVITDRAAGEQLTLTAQHRGYKQAHLRVAVPTFELSGTEEVTLVLVQQATLRGQVVDQQGRPVPKARLEVFSPMGTGRGGHGHRSPTDADGRFETTAGPVRVRLTAEKDELRSSEVWLEVEPGEVVQGVRLVLEPLGTVVEGLVVGPDGKPVTGARIRPMSALMVQPQWTDGEGRFRLTGLDPGPLHFEVWFAGPSRIRREMTLHPGINRVEVRLPSVHGVHGQVLDEDGQGLGGAHVSMSGDGGNAGATSQADGTFVIEDVPAGEYQLHASKEGYFARSRNVRSRSKAARSSLSRSGSSRPVRSPAAFRGSKTARRSVPGSRPGRRRQRSRIFKHGGPGSWGPSTRRAVLGSTS